MRYLYKKSQTIEDFNCFKNIHKMFVQFQSVTRIMSSSHLVWRSSIVLSQKTEDIDSSASSSGWLKMEYWKHINRKMKTAVALKPRHFVHFPTKFAIFYVFYSNQNHVFIFSIFSEKIICFIYFTLQFLVLNLRFNRHEKKHGSWRSLFQ